VEFDQVFKNCLVWKVVFEGLPRCLDYICQDVLFKHGCEMLHLSSNKLNLPELVILFQWKALKRMKKTILL
jgi:hypothetical protein